MANESIAPERIIDARLYEEKSSHFVCGLENNPHLCDAVHLKQASWLAKIFAAGIFYVHSLTYSSVPCGVLMDPRPVSGVQQRGAELFLFPPCNNQHIVSFKTAVQK